MKKVDNVSVYILKLEISQINNLIVYTNVFKNKDKLNLKVVGKKKQWKLGQKWMKYKVKNNLRVNETKS